MPAVRKWQVCEVLIDIAASAVVMSLPVADSVESSVSMDSEEILFLLNKQ